MAKEITPYRSSPQERANRRWRDRRVTITLFVDPRLVEGIDIAVLRSAAYAAIYRLGGNDDPT